MKLRTLLVAHIALVALATFTPAADAAPGCSDIFDGGCAATLCVYSGPVQGCQDADDLIACPHWGCWPPLLP
jgi:hypothetical protein